MRQISNDLKSGYELTQQVITAVSKVIELTEEHHKLRRDARTPNLLRQLPIDSLTEVKKELKAELGKEYKLVRIRYRGPRPNTVRIPNTEENLLKIIALGKDAYRTESQRASSCLKKDATHYAIYDNRFNAR